MTEDELIYFTVDQIGNGITFWSRGAYGKEYHEATKQVLDLCDAARSSRLATLREVRREIKLHLSRTDERASISVGEKTLADLSSTDLLATLDAMIREVERG